MARSRAVLLVWLVLTAWAGALHLRATLAPPPGRVFAGTFHWVDDVYNYASYVQQAEDGRFLMRNKLLDPAVGRAQLVNLEWWLVGRLSAAIGRRPMLAYRLFAVLATLALVAAAERWLAAAGVPPSHRLAGLLLVCLGGGLGGVLFEATDRPAGRCLDMYAGIFPYLEALANPHFVAGTALLAWALWLFAFAPSPAGVALAVLLGSVLGLVRPYDLALLGLVRGLVVLSGPRPGWLRGLLALCGLLPVLAYDVWLYFGSEQFASFRAGGGVPAAVDFLPALGPAVALAALSLRDRPSTGAERSARAHLWAWSLVALVIAAARPGSFPLQFLVGAGLPLLVLGACGLRARPVGHTLLALLLLSSSVVVQTRMLLGDDPNWFVPAERMAAARALRPLCQADDRLLAPPDLSLFAIGLTRCSAVAAHPAAPDFEARLAEVRAFYTTASVGERLALLETLRVTHLALPGHPGPGAEAWLGPGGPFAARASVGVGPTAITLYARARGGSD